ncbi:protein croquemort-like [Anopheles albimanus]|uniref:Scavenger receptor class B n=1 Tax=Anopheles albimanus TaxID=7167 RepID=A0A8W7K950_ANOAL|nr:protein croquemort-like [Anopheles albimanus]
MCCCSKRYSNTAKKLWAFGGVVAIFVAAAFFGFGLPAIIDAVALTEFRIKEGARVYENFFDGEVPIYFDIYLFNWTNPEEVRNPNVKPNFVQMGPYVFSERHERGMVSFNDNDTITFNQKRIWHYIPEQSNGDYFNDRVTTLNPILATVGKTLEGDALLPLLDNIIMLNGLGEFLYEDVPVHQMLFDGRPDLLLTTLGELLAILPPGTAPDISLPPWEGFGWFVERNGSLTYDGTFQMGTGVDHHMNTGVMRQWNFNPQVPNYRGICGQVRGSAGEVWPPLGRNLGDNIAPLTLFLPDLCSAITLRHEGEFSVHGLDGELWVGDKRNFDNGHTIPETECQCTAQVEECPVYPPGVLDVSECKFGAPLLVSYPHFYLADPSYVNAVTGLNPNRAQHEFRFALHPFSGIPMTANGRVQYNMHLKDYGLTLFRDVPDIVIPAFWIEQRVVLTEDIADDLKLIDDLRWGFIYTAFALGGVGALLLGLSLYASFFVWKD